MTLAAAIDLGTTRIKAALLGEDGNLAGVTGHSAPPLQGEGLVRESDAALYLEAARETLESLPTEAADSLPLGLASQRSSFLIWERSSGRPLTPLVSWQDRRAAEWCDERRGHNARITELTGLPLSPHYAAPKVAVLLGRDRSLAGAASSGKALFGTLDTWFAWNMTSPPVHVTDRSMAARTLMTALDDGDWSADLLAFFGLPRAMLPRVAPTWGRRDRLAGGTFLAASAADQAAALFSLPEEGVRPVLVNLGTGGFVLLPTGGAPERRKGYLAGPAASAGGKRLFFSEGTVNGIANALEGLPAPAGIPPEDPSPDLFCIPDSAGTGAPFWRPGVGPVFSRAREELTDEELGRVVREGVVFRVCGIIGDLLPRNEAGACYLAGGISADSFLAEGISSVIERPCFRLREREATLLGAARLAGGTRQREAPMQRIPSRPSYLRDKFSGWGKWVSRVLA